MSERKRVVDILIGVMTVTMFVLISVAVSYAAKPHFKLPQSMLFTGTETARFLSGKEAQDFLNSDSLEAVAIRNVIAQQTAVHGTSATSTKKK
ncbi:MAG: hypothetical protein NUV90_00715 [Candidatus Parcubacteria bacterium]|nr:hypothetical protein [Candidatus Parcubacteria bacterium]